MGGLNKPSLRGLEWARARNSRLLVIHLTRPSRPLSSLVFAEVCASCLWLCCRLGRTSPSAAILKLRIGCLVGKKSSIDRRLHPFQKNSLSTTRRCSVKGIVDGPHEFVIRGKVTRLTFGGRILCLKSQSLLFPRAGSIKNIINSHLSLQWVCRFSHYGLCRSLTLLLTASPPPPPQFHPDVSRHYHLTAFAIFSTAPPILSFYSENSGRQSDLRL
ncbi:unnamed protein product [Chondrus crispus]|uniref:Uncharacterized protein n=1 Tax=Chondrus crispus TaxID=2769 RepID=R7QLH5_CHOCR|nr:unnamed protein product [Chondrus crispus]CDF39352.1 unnamed protein product [Chondrus crispus]|eukprot:XP_005719263.1 unnamed protein product [Chondrus crispus]